MYPGGPGKGLGVLGAVFTGVGPFQHAETRDRPPEIFAGKVTLHAGPGAAGARPAADHPVRPDRKEQIMPTFRWSDLAVEAVDPEHSSGSGSVYQGESIEVARVTYPAGTRIAAHATPHEAVHSILRGRARFRVGGQEKAVGPGRRSSCAPTSSTRPRSWTTWRW